MLRLSSHFSKDQVNFIPTEPHLALFQELAFYTLSKGDEAFIHQHAVDAYAAQHADSMTRPIKIIFGLVGLYLALDRGWTGRQIQLFHMKMARHKRDWPTIDLPTGRGSLSVEDVLAASPGYVRDLRIMDWCRSTWDAYAASHATIRQLVSEMEPLA
jgi:Family of unknown function (DUF5946)